jgi:hypothetical protein
MIAASSVLSQREKISPKKPDERKLRCFSLTAKELQIRGKNSPPGNTD